jgi:hypothetical protein
MGKPNVRLNPKIDSLRSRVLLLKAIPLLLTAAMLLPERKQKDRGRKPYDYRIVLVLNILRILLRKRYADYESEMRTNKMLMEMLNVKKLPCKSTVNNYFFTYSLGFLSSFNRMLVDAWIKKPVDLLLDASGIRLVGRSIWFCIRTKQKILKKDCDKIHIAISHCSLLIANFKISNSKCNDSPFLKKLLQPFRVLGIIIADKGYSGRKNTFFVTGKKGAFFCPFKNNVKPSGYNVWAYAYKIYTLFPTIWYNIYHQRSRVEAVFSALKNRYDDQLYSKKWYSRRREMAMRFIAYNVKVIIGISIARELDIPLWVRAKKA